MIAVFRRMWTVAVSTALVVVCLVVGAAIRSDAQTPAPNLLEIALPSRHEAFTGAPAGALLDMTRLAPGVTTRAVMGVRNASEAAVSPRVAMFHVVEHDRCASGPICSHHGVHIASRLRFAIDTARTLRGPYRRIWAGDVHELISGTGIGGALGAGKTRWVRLSATLPAAAGNAVQNELLSFGLNVSMDAGVLGISSQAPGHTHHIDRIRIAGLAMTGTQFALISVTTFVLLTVGVIFLLVGLVGRTRPGAPRLEYLPPKGIRKT